MRFQPSNHDAISELLSLLPPDNSPPIPASSSSDQQHLEHMFQHLGIAKPKTAKVPPFARSANDIAKIKISILPTTDIPLWEHHRETTGKGKQKLTMTMKTELTDREREIQMLRRENIALPGWDRYQIRKA